MRIDCCFLIFFLARCGGLFPQPCYFRCGEQSWMKYQRKNKSPLSPATICPCAFLLSRRKSTRLLRCSWIPTAPAIASPSRIVGKAEDRFPVAGRGFYFRSHWRAALWKAALLGPWLLALGWDAYRNRNRKPPPLMFPLCCLIVCLSCCLLTLDSGNED